MAKIATVWKTCRQLERELKALFSLNK